MSELFSSGDIAAAASSMSDSGNASPDPTSAPEASPAPDLALSASGSPDSATPAIPAAPAQAVSPTKPQGPIPFEAHTRAIENARTKEAERVRTEVTQQLQQQYAWVNQHKVTPESVQTMHAVRQQMVADPAAFTAEYFTHVLGSGNPEHIRAIRAIAARVLGQRQTNAASQPAAMAEEPKPDVPLVNEHGQITGYTFSAQELGKRDAWLRQQFMADVDQRIQPLEQTRAELEKQRQETAYDRQAQEWTTQTLGKLRQKPYFKEHESAIKSAFAGRGEVPDAQVGEVLLECYLDVLTTQVLPKLSQVERAKVLGHLQTKPAASSTNPGRTHAAPPASQTPAAERPWTDLLQEEWQRRSASA